MSAALVAERLRKDFRLPASGRGQARGLVRAVDDVSFEVPSGGALGLVGESGSGKTTIARMLVGLVRPDAGRITVAGVDRTRLPRGRRGRVERARAAQMVFQDPYLSLDPRLTAEDAVATALRLHGWRRRADRSARARELLDHVGLSLHEARARPGELSGGQRQRVAIARALAVEPNLLVLDEAVAALDVSIQAQVLDLIARLRAGTGVAYVFVSHDLAVVRHVTDTVLVLRHGRLVEQGPTEDVLTQPRADYTRHLVAAVPRPGWDPESLTPRPASSATR